MRTVGDFREFEQIVAGAGDYFGVDARYSLVLENQLQRAEEAVAECSCHESFCDCEDGEELVFPAKMFVANVVAEFEQRANMNTGLLH